MTHKKAIGDGYAEKELLGPSISLHARYRRNIWKEKAASPLHSAPWTFCWRRSGCGNRRCPYRRPSDNPLRGISSRESALHRRGIRGRPAHRVTGKYGHQWRRELENHWAYWMPVPGRMNSPQKEKNRFRSNVHSSVSRQQELIFSFMMG